MNYITFDQHNIPKYEKLCKMTSVTIFSYEEYIHRLTKTQSFFDEWLHANRGVRLSESETVDLVYTYVNYFGLAKDIPKILGRLEREHRIVVPRIGGILSQEYWVKKLNNRDNHEPTNQP